MHSLAYYAILGSLIAGAAGALVLVAVAITHSLKRGPFSGGDPAPEDRARRQRIVRLADTFALLCFAVSTGLAIVAVTHQVRATSLAVAARDVGEILVRLEALETRLMGVEMQQQAGARLAAESGAGQERIGRLERRIDAVEARATPVAPRVLKGRATRTTVPASSPAERVTVAQPPHREMPAQPVSVPIPSDGVAIPEVVTTRNSEPATTTLSREPSAGSAVIAPPIGRAEKLRNDWEELKRNAREGEWRETWNDLKRFFRH